MIGGQVVPLSLEPKQLRFPHVFWPRSVFLPSLVRTGQVLPPCDSLFFIVVVMDLPVIEGQVLFGKSVVISCPCWANARNDPVDLLFIFFN